MNIFLNMKKVVLVLLLSLLCGTVGFPQGKITRTEKSNTLQKKRQNHVNKPIEVQEEKTDDPVSEDNVFTIGYSESDGYAYGHGYVDLGLPSGNKWATCNIGGSLPEDYGDFFAYAETEPKNEYSPCNSITLDEKNKVRCILRDYTMRKKGFFNLKNLLASTHDVSKIKWGRHWSIPTKKDWDELKKSCTWTWIYHGELTGFLITGPNGKSIFLRPAGLGTSTNIKGRGIEGNYMSSEVDLVAIKKDAVYITAYDSKEDDKIFVMYFDKDMKKVSAIAPYFGYSIRPVMTNNSSTLDDISDRNATNPTDFSKINEPEGIINGYGYIDLGLPSGNKWAICNLGANRPEDKGDSYQWSETSKPDRYNTKHTKSQDKSINKLKSKKIIDTEGNLTLSHDAANKNMGANWQIPSKLDFKELLDYCEWISLSFNDVDGWLIIGTNGHTLFIPHPNSKNEKHSFTDYWTATAAEDPAHSFMLMISDNDAKLAGYGYRDNWNFIRPVAK